ncbi:MAG: phosphoribosylamine--glycine ligase [Actinobacteria bacterium]|nr:phosphoribosylamine--glycine ligase [Actinomycetota bacterium]
MKILVVGGGGREHALVHAFASSSLQPTLFCAPGNAGIAAEAECLPIGAEDIDELLRFAYKEKVDLTVVGPEAPLVAGIADTFTAHGLLTFGTDRAASELEGSKSFAKDVMYDAKAPTGRFRRHDNLADALRCLEVQDTYPLVIKADGLAAGKGVVIAHDFQEARRAVEENLRHHRFGAASDSVLIEEHLTGSEVSLLALCDGSTILPMAPAQDYKRIFADDEGPNTGGMGSYCPVPGFGQHEIDFIVETVYEPVIEALRRRDITFRGVLYGGLIITDDGARILEFNCRFGDPETQAILPRLRSDLLEVCLATARGELAGVRLDWHPDACVSVVMASRGYPESSSRGDVISGLDDAAALEAVDIYHAGTGFGETSSDGTRPVVTAGGRVLAVSALGETFKVARERAYQGIERIAFPGMQFRPDIAARAVRAERGEWSLFPPGWAG